MKSGLLALLIMSSLFLYSQENKDLFRGGMILHTGYLQNNVSQNPINGPITGIGGKLSFHTGKHMRLGTEGHVSSYNYSDGMGFYKFGWGGILVEYQFSQGNLRPVLGLTLGGGIAHDLYVVSGDFTDHKVDLSIYKTYSTLVLSPNFSMEYSFTDHISLVGKVDYNFYPGNIYPDYIGNGLRLYIGVLFSR